MKISQGHDTFIELDYDKRAGLEVTVSDFAGSLGSPHNQANIWLEADEIIQLRDYLIEVTKV